VSSKGFLSTSIWTSLAAAMWPRSASSPSLTSIMAVAPSLAASGPASYGGGGGGRGGGRPAGAGGPAARTGRPPRPVPRPPGHRALVTGTRTRAHHRAAAAEVTEAGHGQQPRGRTRRVAAGHAGAGPHALRGQALGQPAQPGNGQAGRGGEGDEQAGRHGAHR